MQPDSTSFVLIALALASLLAALLPGVALAAPYPPRAYLPMAYNQFACPSTSTAHFNTISVPPYNEPRPADRHGDLNLSLRGYEPVAQYAGLVDYSGATDGDAPQMPGLFADGRVPAFTRTWAVYDWTWTGCGADGCRGGLLANPPVTLLGMAVRPGEPIRIPSRNAQIAGGGYKAVVLYAETRRITLKYTCDNNVVSGYTVHIENVCVDPNLLALYQAMDGQGRGNLPALHNGETLGVGSDQEMRVAIRDNGNFMDPRSRKDWWVGR
jgi:hypothetical protein